MANPKVSVIIPVYNTDKYLVDSISSIQNQTIQDIEILIINDGSTDRSEIIIKILAEKDLRIKYFVQENKGPSLSRNFGIRQAHGDYLYFMDSDDFLDNDALERCYNRCRSYNLDFLFFDATSFSDNGSEEIVGLDYVRRGKIDEGIYRGKEILESLINKNLYRVPVWQYLIKKSYLDKIDLWFFPGIIHDDELFTPILYLKAEKVGYISVPFFHRRIRPNSIMTRKFSIINLKAYIVVLEQLRLYSIGIDAVTNAIINSLIRLIINPVMYKCNTLSLRERISVLMIFYKKDFLKFISLKSLIVILFPFTITIKSKFLRPFLRNIGRLLMNTRNSKN